MREQLTAFRIIQISKAVDELVNTKGSQEMDKSMEEGFRKRLYDLEKAVRYTERVSGNDQSTQQGREHGSTAGDWD